MSSKKDQEEQFKGSSSKPSKLLFGEACQSTYSFHGLTDMKKIHSTNLDSKEICQSVMKRLFSKEEQQEQKDSFSAKIAQIIDSL